MNVHHKLAGFCVCSNGDIHKVCNETLHFQAMHPYIQKNSSNQSKESKSEGKFQGRLSSVDCRTGCLEGGRFFQIMTFH